jgi:hypothetical protein
MLIRHNTNIATGTLNTVSAASVTGAAQNLFVSNQKVVDLAAHLVVTAATASITVKPYWQVSNDGSTWNSASPNELNSPNASILPVVTGTANVTIGVPAPKVAYAYRYTRCMLLVGGATGAAGDLYSVGYTYRTE